MPRTTPPTFEPPTSASIAARQDETDALRLLIAQRRLYTKAKRWQAVRWIGILVIGLAAPVVTLIWPEAAVAVGAIAGLWLFLGRTLFAWLESRTMTRAAAIQEDFDLMVFGMPRAIERSKAPSLEDIARIAGPDTEVESVAAKEKLISWYPIDTSVPGATSIAIAQRANAEYSHRLLRTTLIVWIAITAVWAIALTVVSLVIGLSATSIALGVVLPVLPAALDVTDYLRNVNKAGTDRGDVARAIGAAIDDAKPIAPTDLTAWQERMFDLRRTTPQIPDWLYKLTRDTNERVMHSAAQQLADRSKESKS